MNCEELQINDWVEYNGLNQKVKEISGLDNEVYLTIDECIDCTQVNPILITAEILEKNEWMCFNTYHKYSHPKAPFNIRQQKDGGYTIEVDADEYGSAMFLFILYVHQLQHCLKLVGIEKEIEL